MSIGKNEIVDSLCHLREVIAKLNYPLDSWLSAARDKTPVCKLRTPEA